MAKKKQATETVYKCTRADGTDFHTGTLNYAAALAAGNAVEVPDAHSAAEAARHRWAAETVCGHGIHVSPTARKTIRFAQQSHRPWRYFEGTVCVADVIERDEQKLRVRRFTPTRELSLADIFGADFAKRVELVNAEISTWKDIPWLEPEATLTKKQIVQCVERWRAALQPWLSRGRQLSTEVEIVTTADDAVAAASVAHVGLADADADADAAVADADAAAADAAVAAAVAAAAAAVAHVGLAAAAAADAADADAAVASAAHVGLAAAAAAADADADWPYWLRYYVRPYWVLRRYAWWKIAAVDGENPWEPMVELYRLGVMPIGFSRDRFVVLAAAVGRRQRGGRAINVENIHRSVSNPAQSVYS